jgi:hypothetical protein
MYKTLSSIAQEQTSHFSSHVQSISQLPILTPIMLPQTESVDKSTLDKSTIDKTVLDMKFVTVKHKSTEEPSVWGPSYWFTLHNSAVYYPIKASPFFIERMKGFILGIPVMVPCEQCRDHATAYIESVYQNLEQIVSGRDSLFKFFVDFHNYVNKRLNKPEMSYQDAYNLYKGTPQVTKMTYKKE